MEGMITVETEQAAKDTAMALAETERLKAGLAMERSEKSRNDAETASVKAEAEPTKVETEKFVKAFMASVPEAKSPELEAHWAWAMAEQGRRKKEALIGRTQVEGETVWGGKDDAASARETKRKYFKKEAGNLAVKMEGIRAETERQKAETEMVDLTDGAGSARESQGISWERLGGETVGMMAEMERMTGDTGVVDKKIKSWVRVQEGGSAKTGEDKARTDVEVERKKKEAKKAFEERPKIKNWKSEILTKWLYG